MAHEGDMMDLLPHAKHDGVPSSEQQPRYLVVAMGKVLHYPLSSAVSVEACLDGYRQLVRGRIVECRMEPIQCVSAISRCFLNVRDRVGGSGSAETPTGVISAAYCWNYNPRSERGDWAWMLLRFSH